MLVFTLVLRWVFAPLPAAAQVTPATNFQGLWWAAPAGSESGWGINFAHQGEVIFATWFTYNSAGISIWWTMTAFQVSTGVFTGTLVQTAGTPVSTVPYDPNDLRLVTNPGEATLTFTSPTTGYFNTRMGSVNQNKPITLQIFGAVPTCVWGAQADLARATNYTDLWWASPPNSEPGWGINLTHQGTTIFATWFVYNLNSGPIWYSVTAPQIAQGVYSGTLYRTKGPPYWSDPFSPGAVSLQEAGSAIFAFSDGNNALFTYSLIDGFQTNGAKPITRQVFRPPGTVCH